MYDAFMHYLPFLYHYYHTVDMIIIIHQPRACHYSPARFNVPSSQYDDALPARVDARWSPYRRARGRCHAMMVAGSTRATPSMAAGQART